MSLKTLLVSSKVKVGRDIPSFHCSSPPSQYSKIMNSLLESGSSMISLILTTLG